MLRRSRFLMMITASGQPDPRDGKKMERAKEDQLQINVEALAKDKSPSDTEALKNEYPSVPGHKYGYEDQGVGAAGPFGFGTLDPFEYGSRFKYIPMWTPFTFVDFMLNDRNQINMVFRTFTHRQTGVKVTLIPIIHVGHPAFFKRVDLLCSQHDSVLMEGRCPQIGAEYSSIVPPRKMMGQVRPEGHEDDEGWEPLEDEGFWQPYSWGVIDSPNYTVIHAADKYDYEKLPYWAAVRFSMPIFGNFDRDKHCLDMIGPLSENGYKSFAIPWGLYHMPVMATMLLRNGFIETGSGQLNVFTSADGLVSNSWCKKMAWKRYLHMKMLLVTVWSLVIGFAVAWDKFMHWKTTIVLDQRWNLGHLWGAHSDRWVGKKRQELEEAREALNKEKWSEIKKELRPELLTESERKEMRAEQRRIEKKKNDQNASQFAVPYWAPPPKRPEAKEDPN